MVRALYRTFWLEGKDISNPLILDELGLADGADLDQVVDEWNRGWQATGQSGVPLLVAPDGEILVGCMPADAIRRFMYARSESRKETDV